MAWDEKLIIAWLVTASLVIGLVIGYLIGERAAQIEVELVNSSSCTLTWEHPTADKSNMIRMFVCEDET